MHGDDSEAVEVPEPFDGDGVNGYAMPLSRSLDRRSAVASATDSRSRWTPPTTRVVWVLDLAWPDAT